MASIYKVGSKSYNKEQYDKQKEDNYVSPTVEKYFKECPIFKLNKLIKGKMDNSINDNPIFMIFIVNGVDMILNRIMV